MPRQSGEYRLAAAVAGDAAADLEAAARGEGIGRERLADATDVLEGRLELDVDRGRLARTFFFAQAAKEDWLQPTAEAKEFTGFPFRILREGGDSDGAEIESPASRSARLDALAARERADDRAQLVAGLAADLAHLADSLKTVQRSAADSAAYVNGGRVILGDVGERSRRAIVARGQATALARPELSTRAAAAAAGTGAGDEPLRRTLRGARSHRARARKRAARRSPTAPPRADRAAAPCTAGAARRRGRTMVRGSPLRQSRPPAVGPPRRRSRPTRTPTTSWPAQAAGRRVARGDRCGGGRLDGAPRRGPRRGRPRPHREQLATRAQADYEVALFERAAWSAIALDEGGSTAADLAPAISACDEFLAKFPASSYVGATEFNRADLDVRLAYAQARASGRAPDFGPAVARYERLLTSTPPYSRKDAVLFNLAALAREANDFAASDRWLTQLLQVAPNSELAREAHVELGDRALDAERWGEAEQHYAAVAAAGGTLAPLARYKQGYAALKQGDAATASEAFADSGAARPARGSRATALRSWRRRCARAAARPRRALPRRAPEGAVRTRPPAPARRPGERDAVRPRGEVVAVRHDARRGCRRTSRPDARCWARGTRLRDDEREAARVDLGHFFAPGGAGADSDPMPTSWARSLQAAFSRTRPTHEEGSGRAGRAGRSLPRAQSSTPRTIHSPWPTRARARRCSTSAASFESAAAQARWRRRRDPEMKREAAFGAALARRVAAADGYKTPAVRDSLEHAIQHFETASPGTHLAPGLSLALGARTRATSRGPTRCSPMWQRRHERGLAPSQAELAASRSPQALARRREAPRRGRLPRRRRQGGGGPPDRPRGVGPVQGGRAARGREGQRARRDHVPRGRGPLPVVQAGRRRALPRRARCARRRPAARRRRSPRDPARPLPGFEAARRRAAQARRGRDRGEGHARRGAGPGPGPRRFGRARGQLEQSARLYRGAGAYTDAEAAYRKILKDSPDPRARTRALADLATLQYELGRRAELPATLAPWRTGHWPEGFAPDPEADVRARFVLGRVLADSCLALPIAHPIKPALDRKLAVLGPALENLKAAARTTDSPYWAESGYHAGLLLDDLGSRLAVLPPPTKMSAADSAGYKSALDAQARSFYGRAEDLWIAALEGMPAAPADTAARATRPADGWRGKIWDKLDPRLAAHYPWRFSAFDLPPPEPGAELVASAEPWPRPRPPIRARSTPGPSRT